MPDESSHTKIFEHSSKILEGDYGLLVQVLGLVFFILIFHFLMANLLGKLKLVFEKRRQVWAFSVVSALQKPLAYLVWFVASFCIFDTILSTILGTHIANMHIFLSIGAVLAFSWFLIRCRANILEQMREMSASKKISITPGKLDVLSKLATIFIIFVTIFLLMDVTGRNMQTLIAFGGIGGLALAFASQQVISNFFGGLMVYITQPFTIGEWVCLPERKIEGHIEEIGWYLTRIRSFDKRPIYVPNSIFTQTVVITPSRMSHERFFHTIGIRYRDIKALTPIIDNIKRLLAKHPSIDQQLNADVFFKSFGQSSLDIEISAYFLTNTDVRFSAIKQEILLKIADIVEQAGAEIATPTNVVEIRDSIMIKRPEINSVIN